jgi:hypothetical protein
VTSTTCVHRIPRSPPLLVGSWQLSAGPPRAGPAEHGQRMHNVRRRGQGGNPDGRQRTNGDSEPKRPYWESAMGRAASRNQLEKRTLNTLATPIIGT